MLYNEQTHELFTIRDDVVDPTGQSDAVGRSCDIALDHGKIEVPVRYKDVLAVLDVYEMDDQLMVNLYCPRCANSLRIESKSKRIKFIRETRRISISKFGCTYDGCGLCIEITDNVARDSHW